MKKILIAILLLLSCAPALATTYATPVRTAHYQSASATGTTLTLTGVTLAAGENVAVWVAYHAAGGTGHVTAFVESGGVNTYGLLPTTYVDSNSDAWEIYYAKNVSALVGGTITITLSASSDGANLITLERWTGLDPTASPSNAYSNTQVSPGTATDGVTTGAMTPSVANAMVLAIGYDLNHGTGHMAAGTGYTSLGLTGAAGVDAITEYKVISSTTPLAATFTTDINDGRQSSGAVFPLAVIGSSIVPIVVSEMLH